MNSIKLSDKNISQILIVGSFPLLKMGGLSEMFSSSFHKIFRERTSCIMEIINNMELRNYKYMFFICKYVCM